MPVMQASTTRPGPLRDIPVDNHLKVEAIVRPNKRPLSPGTPSIFSPAKRRLFAQEGLLSPDQSLRGPIGPVLKAKSPFQSSLSGPGSPARRLDFGAPVRNFNLPAGPTVELSGVPCIQLDTAVTSKLQPSPELLGSRSRTRPSSSVNPPSIHYPGFEIWKDPATELPSVSSESAATLSGDDDKENSVSLTKHKKSSASPVSKANLPDKHSLLTPERKRTATPSTLSSASRSGPHTPTKQLTGLEITPGCASRIDRHRIKFGPGLLASQVNEDACTEEDTNL